MIRAWTLSGSGSGCYYSNDYETSMYGKTYVSNIPVHVRYYKDSYISADELTMGCSSSSSSSSSCFGASEKEQNITGAVITIIGVLLIALEIVAIVALCMCFKETLSKLTKKKSKKQIMPAQPVYPSAAQPGYPPAGQPGYPPAGQPGYPPPPPPAY